MSKDGRKASEKKIKMWREEKNIYVCLCAHTRKKRKERKKRK
jgi:hypothetical protein